ncbi:DUF1566 domain-containing protein [Salipiger abyssi]|uniref:DUF1566 domain-containing protein n=1 Tax=Salipiger abyssi TaxID=1250539 RepID=UPI001A8FD301|nr:DUF1566 domain-containing protein [Salipiger abyssi]MBN9889378.1 DUF1566 domain-containing protein [Salipiger abyssi]
MFRVSLWIFILSLFVIPNAAQAQTSADFSGVGGGSIRVGADTDTCDSSKEGAIRYNSSSSCAEYCDGNDWTCPSSGGCVAPTLCPNVGDVCDDSDAGTTNDPIFAGFILYGTSCEALYVTDDNQSAGTEWRTPNPGLDDIATDSYTDGRASSDQIANSTTFPAFKLCKDLTDGGYSDWYLPSIDEMWLLAKNSSDIDVNASGSFTSNSYWISNEAGIYNAFQLDMSVPYFNNFAPKDATLEVRCVRRD